MDRKEIGSQMVEFPSAFVEPSVIEKRTDKDLN